jgi:uncharacterized protein
MPEKALKNVAARYHLTVEQAAEILQLLGSGYSIPYVMRYHKELAAGLEAEGFYELIEEERRIEKLESRRRKVLKKLEERDLLTDELREKIERATDMRELIDYYVPFRPRKRSRSRQALAQGLKPLAAAVLSQEEFIPDMGQAAEPYVSPEQGLESVGAVLEGVFAVVSDWVAEEKGHRDRQREVLRREAEVVAIRSRRSVPGRLVREFRSYFDFRERASKIHPYHMLCILRGKRLKALDYEVRAPLDAMMREAAGLYLAGGVSQLEQVEGELGGQLPGLDGNELKGLNGTEFLVACIRYSLTNVLIDVATRELDKDLCKKAEALALGIIRRNLKSLLMTQPVPRRMLAVHPGYRTGCNVAALDEAGAVLETTTVYPHAPQKEMEAARETLCRLIDEHNLEVAAIGDGIGCEETEALVGELIAEKYGELRYAVVSEVGLDAYVTSRAAKTELPEVEADERAAVALGRRLQDPLSELVKVNPRELCLEPYVDEVNGGALKKLLDRTIEECVCKVGVDANADHYSLLRYVCGLGPDKALELVDYRDKRGPLKSRRELREVPKIDGESYERAVGFVRVGASDSRLDVTRIHPRLYPVAEAIAAQLDMSLADLASEEGRQAVRERASEVKLTELEKEFGVHYLLLKDIVSEMHTPWPDPREDRQAPVLRQKALSVEELEPGQWLTGTVRNIVDFGVFVDIGVGEDGLIHISELSDSYVQSPYDVVCVSDRVRVRVVRVDEERRRIALSMRAESAPRERKGRERRRRRAPAESRRESRPVAAEVPSEKPGSAVQTPRSTLGGESRRYKKAALSEPLSKTKQQMLKKSGQPDEPRREEAEDEAKPKGEGLLGKLDFASIERRGERSD